MAEEKQKLPYKGYIVDRGIPFDGVQKAVDFYDGVGILDYEAVAIVAPDWFERNKSGEIVAVKENSVSMETFVEYWEKQGAKVTRVTESEAKEIAAAIKTKSGIDAKYLKAAVDTRAIAGAKKKEPTPKVDGTDEEYTAPVSRKGRR